MSHVMRKPDFCICKNKGADQISAFVFATQESTQKMQFLLYLDPTFQDSSFPLMLHRPVCVRSGWKPPRLVFLRRGSFNSKKHVIKAFANYMVLIRNFSQDLSSLIASTSLPRKFKVLKNLL